MNCEQLRFMVDIFEAKVNELEDEYKNKHWENFNENKMKQYVNNKLKREIKILIFCNMIPSFVALKNSERLKY